MIRIDSIRKSSVQNLLGREVRVVEFEDSLTPEWILDLKPKKLWSKERAVAIVRDVATNEIFKVRENQIRWHLRGDNQPILFVNRESAK